METKKCWDCKILKNALKFSKSKNRKGGLSSRCKQCASDYYKKYKKEIAECRKIYYKKHKKKIINNKKSYRKTHKKEIAERKKIYHIKHQYELIEKNNKYYRTHKKQIVEQHKKYFRKQYQNNVKFRLKNNVSCLINNRLKKRKTSKNGKSTFSFLPYTIEELMAHLEKLFKPGMTWENRSAWHIDHKKPDSKFNYKSVEDEEFQRCWALENLQPLWSKENIKKSNKY